MLDMKNVPVFNYTYPQEHYQIGDVYAFWVKSNAAMDSAKPEEVEEFSKSLEVEAEVAPVEENGKVFVIGVVVDHETQGFYEIPAIKVMFKYLVNGEKRYHCRKFIVDTQEPSSGNGNVLNVSKLFPNPYIAEQKQEKQYSLNGKEGKVLASHLL